MKTILLLICPGEEKYLTTLKPLFSGKINIQISNVVPTTVMEVVLTAREKNCSGVATTSSKLLQLIMGSAKGRGNPSIDDYAGSLIERYGMEFLLLPPMEQLFTITYTKFLYARYMDKYIHPERFIPMPEFTHEIFDPKDTDRWIEEADNATFIANDIETFRDDTRTISCFGHSFVRIDAASKSFTIRTLVIPANSGFNIAVERRILQSTAPKVFQNGKYDNAYLLRYSAHTRNYAFDTINLFHSWYSELPKDLAFITTFLLRKWEYWKDESKTSDILEYYRYNAKDNFATALSLLALLTELPPYAEDNFIKEFPLVFPCMLVEAQGLAVDKQQMKVVRDQLTIVSDRELLSLRKMVGNSFYNPGSWQQTQILFSILGSGDVKSTGKIGRDKVASRHPLNKKLMNAIKKYRESVKLNSTYTSEENLWNERIYFAINPHGTDTGRLASKESQFWCGLQIQNIPRDRKDVKIKSFFRANAGFLFGEADYSQAEARDTAYLSGDTALIAAVEDLTKDFHSKNAAAFFGIAYEEICNSYQMDSGAWEHVRLLLDIIDIAKRTNHGANYNMGAGVMLDTMGIENVLKAKKLLKLPGHLSLLKVTDYLLTMYAKTYPIVKGAWYDKVKADVVGSKMLVGPTGWTRYCFGDPVNNKRHLNSYVAHPPQSLNAMTLNIAYMKVFYNVWMQNKDNFRLGPQIHDSIHFQYREGYEHLAWQVKECMEFSIPVQDTFGIIRNLTVPVDLKGGSPIWSELKKLHKKSEEIVAA